MMDTLSVKQQQILALLVEGRANPKLIIEECEDLETQQQVNYNLRSLRAESLVERRVQGLYEITEKGREVVSAGKRDDYLGN